MDLIAVTDIVGEYTQSNSFLMPLIAFLATISALMFFKRHLMRYLKKIAKKTKSDLDDLLLNLVERIPLSFYVLASLFVALKFAQAPKFIEDTVGYAVILVATYYAVLASQIIIDQFSKKIVDSRRAEDPKDDVSLIKLIAKILKYSMWIVGVLLFLANIDVDISAILAGMGVGGIAIALAAQNVLGDVFAAFSIYFDKPYKVGDFILVSEDWGEVIKIGIKTTRIKTLRGEELVVSNREMTTTRVHNFGRMPHRRVDFALGITYQTPVEKVKKIPEMIKSIIELNNLVRFDRAHFKKFGDFSLEFEIVYYIDSPDYNKYMDTQQAINLAIMEAFEKEGIKFAYPTQTIYIPGKGE